MRDPSHSTFNHNIYTSMNSEATGSSNTVGERIHLRHSRHKPWYDMILQVEPSTPCSPKPVVGRELMSSFDPKNERLVSTCTTCADELSNPVAVHNQTGCKMTSAITNRHELAHASYAQLHMCSVYSRTSVIRPQRDCTPAG